MLKLLFILVLLGFQPIPRQVSSNPTSNSSDDKNDSKTKHENSAPPVPVIEQTSSPKRETPSNSEADKDTNHSIAIREFPSVSITKDWADWGVWWFSGLLVLVSGFQARLLWRTLRAIRSQADQMENQTTILGESVAIAKQSAETTAATLKAMIDKERARLSIEVGDFEIEGIPQVSFKIMCYGTTPAYIVSSWQYAEVSPIPDYSWNREAFGFSVHNLPSVNPTGAIESESIIMDTDLHEGNTFDNLPEIAKKIKTKIAEGDLYIHFRVRICYRDIFESERIHTVQISKIYGVERDIVSDGMSGVVYAALTKDDLLRLPEWHDSRYKYDQE